MLKYLRSDALIMQRLRESAVRKTSRPGESTGPLDSWLESSLRHLGDAALNEPIPDVLVRILSDDRRESFARVDDPAVLP